MTDTVQTIGERLDPRTSSRTPRTPSATTVGRVEQMTSNAMDTADDTGSGILETIRRNPLPSGDGRGRHRLAPDEPQHGRSRTDLTPERRRGTPTDRAGETFDRWPSEGRAGRRRRPLTVGSTVGQLPTRWVRRPVRSAGTPSAGPGQPARPRCRGLRGRRRDRDGAPRNGRRAQRARRPGGDRHRHGPAGRLRRRPAAPDDQRLGLRRLSARRPRPDQSGTASGRFRM